MVRLPLPLLASLVVLLSACGGGGSSDSATAPPDTSSSGAVTGPPASTTPPATDTPVADPPAIALPSSTYTGERAAAFARLNTERQRCGFAPLAQSAAIDVAAQAHADYLQANNVISHDEDPAKPGFFGANLPARLAAAGVGFGAAGEVVWPSYGLASGADAIQNLLAVPYHARILLASYADVGIGYASGENGTRVVVDLAAGAGGETGNVVTYPCEGTAEARPVNAGEVPSPLPGRLDATWGQPILVRGAFDLQVRSVTITGPLGSLPVQVVYGQGQTPDPNGMVPAGWAVVLPGTMAANTTYRVAIVLFSGGMQATREFSFRTAR